MARKEDFDKGLYEFAISAWNQRDDILKADFYYIYENLYNNSGISKDFFMYYPNHNAILKAFLADLLHIRGYNSDIHVSMQQIVRDPLLNKTMNDDLRREDLQFYHVATFYPNHNFLPEGKNKKKKTWESETLWEEFYHFIPVDFDDSHISKRIYIHASKWEHACQILGKLVPLCTKTPGFQEIKIVGPGGFYRLDQIVAYFDHQKAVDSALKIIGKMDKNWFAEGIPRVVKPEMKGVGVADEPADVRVLEDEDAGSFGFFISQLVFLAIRETEDDSDEGEYLDVLKKWFEKAFIDVRVPYLFTRRSSLEARLANLGVGSLEELPDKE